MKHGFGTLLQASLEAELVALQSEMETVRSDALFYVEAPARAIGILGIH